MESQHHDPAPSRTGSLQNGMKMSNSVHMHTACYWAVLSLSVWTAGEAVSAAQRKVA
jgi:hypothetical protein